MTSPGLDEKTHNSTEQMVGVDLSHKVMDNSPGLFDNESNQGKDKVLSQNGLDIKKNQSSSRHS